MSTEEAMSRLEAQRVLCVASSCPEEFASLGATELVAAEFASPKRRDRERTRALLRWP
jgi:hypothetical protein